MESFVTQDVYYVINQNAICPYQLPMAWLPTQTIQYILMNGEYSKHPQLCNFVQQNSIQK